MAAFSIVYFRLQAEIFNASLTLTYGSVYFSPVMLIDLESIGIAVGIALLSRIQAET